MDLNDPEVVQKPDSEVFPAPIESVKELDSAKVFRASAVLFDFAKEGWPVPYRLDLVHPNPLPVYEDGEPAPCGFANVHMEGSRIVADITIDYATPVRLLSQIDEPVYVVEDFYVGADREAATLGAERLTFTNRNISTYVFLGPRLESKT